MKQLELISINKQSAKSKRDKVKKLYNWRLERYNSNVEDVFFMDVTPIRPNEYGIQLLKSEIILEMNNRNIFDFPFEPKDEDFLFIENTKDRHDFLSLSFYNEKWVEDFRFIISNRNEVIKSGVLDLNCNYR